MLIVFILFKWDTFNLNSEILMNNYFFIFETTHDCVYIYRIFRVVGDGALRARGTGDLLPSYPTVVAIGSC